MKEKILITAGSTWAKIDEVRVLTNRFTGRTGIKLARALQKSGCDVTLLINPHCVSQELFGLKVVEFYYYDEFKDNVSQLLRKRRFDAIIHTAAVSDYFLPNPNKAKIASGKKSLVLKLKPTQKIIKLMRALDPEALLIQFKLEKSAKGLIDKAYTSLKANDSDFVVANALEDIDKKYLISREKNIVKADGTAQLARNLVSCIATRPAR
jgi:phosphopantothenoylcysteine decarboxylase/phosphopantothenate--cysteine ligase